MQIYYHDSVVEFAQNLQSAGKNFRNGIGFAPTEPADGGITAKPG